MLYQLEPMLQEANFRSTSLLSKMVNYSANAPHHRAWTEEFLIFSHHVMPLIARSGLATADRLEALYHQQEREMGSERFRALVPLLTVWGHKQFRAGKGMISCE